MQTRENIKQSLQAALPIMLGYIAIGLPCGILETSIGFTWWQAFIMSIVFYSGAGQFMIPNMYLASSSLFSIIASVSFVNTRQMLYSASLAPYCQSEKTGVSTFFAATVTDESYGVNIDRFREGNWDVRRALGVNLFSRFTWAAANAVGVLIGDAVGIPLAIASFSMTSIFICLLVCQKWSARTFVAATASALGVFLCKCVGLTGPAILLGAIIGVMVAMVASPLLPKKGSEAVTEPGDASAPSSDRDAQGGDRL